ncbi:MAG: hypothetical protein R3F43_18975 [bacterium]
MGFIDGSVQVSADGGHFRRLLPGGVGPVLDIALDPTDANRVVAVYGGYTGRSARYRTGHVSMTTDGGLSWDDIGGGDGTGPAGNVPDLPCYAARFCARHPRRSSWGPTRAPSSPRGRSGSGSASPRHAPCDGVGAGRGRSRPCGASAGLGTAPPVVAAGTYGRSAFLLTRAATAQLAVDGELGFGVHRAGGGVVQRTLTLANPGGADLVITALALGAPFSLVGAPALPLTLTPGQQQALTAYTPGAAGAPRRRSASPRTPPAAPTSSA